MRGESRKQEEKKPLMAKIVRKKKKGMSNVQFSLLFFFFEIDE